MHLWWDVHPNPEGHRLLARILLDRMKKDRWGPFAADAAPVSGLTPSGSLRSALDVSLARPARDRPAWRGRRAARW